MNDLVLTDAEKELILDKRKQEEKELVRQRNKGAALRVAALYEEWLQSKGRGSTFSTFVNEFEGDPVLFQLVESIRRAADGYPDH